MAQFRTIAYISRTIKEYQTQDLDALLEDARAFNQQHDVTGVLLYNPGFFFQYIEGDKKSIELVYDRIRKSTGHKIIMELHDEESDDRHFTKWTMGFCKAPSGFIQELAHQNWMVKKQSLMHRDDIPHGLQMLLKFWENLASPPMQNN